jgi:hypothetical protein
LRFLIVVAIGLCFIGIFQSQDTGTLNNC